VKNNLQLINSLLSLQAARVAEPAVVELFAESRNRVRAMALVHENLYRDGTLAKIPMAAHVQKLCTQLIRAYEIDGRRIELKTEVGDLALELDRAVCVGLIINELVSNALKHAYPGGRGGCVRVEMRRIDERRCALSVSDDGVGLPRGLAPDKPETLGLQLV